MKTSDSRRRTATANTFYATCRARITWAGVGTVAALAAATAACSSAPGEGKAGSAPSAAAVAPRDAASRVKEFLDGLYTPGDVRHSYTDTFEQKVDCVDFYAEPGVKAAMARGIEFPEPEHLDVPDEVRARFPVSQKPAAAPSEQELRDADGNLRSCPDGTVPHHRVTPGEIAKRGGLDAFLAPPHRTKPRLGASEPGPQHDSVRRPFGGGRFPLDCTPLPVGGVPEIPNYAHTIVDWEGIETTGGISTMSLDTPSIFPTVSGDGGNHYISQTWISNGSGDYMQGCTTDCWETVEAGAWVVDGGTQPTLAVFSTNSGYAPSGTCWAAYGGTSCVTWVPTSSTYYAAMPLPTGDVGGVRQEITIQTQYVVIVRSVRYNGMIYHYRIPIWELIVGLNGAAPTVMGYYLAQDFPGPMGHGSANSFQLGGEIEDDSGNFTTPPALEMGPGVALNRFGVYTQVETPDQMAYHRNYGYTGEPADGAVAPYGTRPCSYGPGQTLLPGYFFFGDIDATFVTRIQ
jgi:hypothetical protein